MLINVPFLGWIANCLDANTLAIKENIATLTHWIRAPCLGVLPFQPKPNKSINQIDLALILRQLHKLALN
ncbi:MAG: hypothetical protein AAGG80_07365 [Pseudomonadota bacterium]